jgi:hypothetical protein
MKRRTLLRGPIESAGCFSRSLHGCDARVARVAMDGHPGLARSMDCAAQWIYGGPENPLPIPAP